MKSKLNYLPKQYQENKIHKINHSYLVEQFFDYKKIFSKIEKIVKQGDYTLGNEVNRFEKNLSKRMGSKHTIAVGNGTDALYLVLKAFNIGRGDEVITSGGIIGTVERVMEDDRIEVLIGDDTKVQIIRSTITSLLKKEEIKK